VAYKNGETYLQLELKLLSLHYRISVNIWWSEGYT